MPSTRLSSTCEYFKGVLGDDYDTPAPQGAPAQHMHAKKQQKDEAEMELQGKTKEAEMDKAEKKTIVEDDNSEDIHGKTFAEVKSDTLNPIAMFFLLIIAFL